MHLPKASHYRLSTNSFSFTECNTFDISNSKMQCKRNSLWHLYGFTLKMGQYRLHEYQCIMSIVWRYSDALLLKSIRSLSILYDHYLFESDKIRNLIEYRSKAITILYKGFSSTKLSFQNFHPLLKTLPYCNDTSIHWCITFNLQYIDTNTETLYIIMHQCIRVSSHLYFT